jgi:ATP-binding protein involved in chromosome partitioning
LTPGREHSQPARFVVAVGSGKGGVGKSTVTLQLALAFARRGLRVGVFDADLYGPDIPLMVGVSREERRRLWNLWRKGGDRLTPFERYGLALVSVGFLIGEGQSFPMAAPLLAATLRQLVVEVEWGSPDILLVDLPPGTADLQQQLLGAVRLDGALVVVGPQDVAHLDGRKFVDFLSSAGVSVLGGIENMSGLVCPHCGEAVEVFPPVSEQRSVWANGLALLGRIPIDPALASSPAEGSAAFDPIAERVLDLLERRPAA